MVSNARKKGETKSWTLRIVKNFLYDYKLMKEEATGKVTGI
jgi:hypothetical protein